MSSRRADLLLPCFAALVLGGFVSLFSAGPALYADGPFSERPPVLAASVIAFAIIGAVLGFVAPRAWKPIAVCLALSAVPVVVVFGRDTMAQPLMLLLSSAFVMGDAAAGMFGAWMGARLKTVAQS